MARPGGRPAAPRRWKVRRRASVPCLAALPLRPSFRTSPLRMDSAGPTPPPAAGGRPFWPRSCGAKLTPSRATPSGSFAPASSAKVGKKSLKSTRSLLTTPAGGQGVDGGRLESRAVAAHATYAVVVRRHENDVGPGGLRSGAAAPAITISHAAHVPIFTSRGYCIIGFVSATMIEPAAGRGVPRRDARGGRAVPLIGRPVRTPGVPAGPPEKRARGPRDVDGLFPRRVPIMPSRSERRASWRISHTTIR